MTDDVNRQDVKTRHFTSALQENRSVDMCVESSMQR